MEIVDPILECEFNRNEAVRMIEVALVCTNSSPSIRPSMSEVVQMLEGEIEVTQVMSDPCLYGHNWSISKLRGIDTHGSSSTLGVNDQTTTTTTQSSVSECDLYPLSKFHRRIFILVTVISKDVHIAVSLMRYERLVTLS